jgi:hypothetical protein
MKLKLITVLCGNPPCYKILNSFFFIYSSFQNSKMNTKTIPSEIINYAIDALRDGRALDIYGCDLHNEIYNTDYFIVGYYQAEQWLIANGGVFNALDLVHQYELDNFGETKPYNNAESLANMVAYVHGADILSECPTLQANWDNKLDQGMIDQIEKELNELL